MSIQQIIESLPNRTKAERVEMRDKAERAQANGILTQQADAAALLAALDKIEAREHDEFIGELKGLEVPERIYRAFTEIPMSDTDVKILQALLDNPGSSSEQLSAFCEWKDKSWHLHFGKMCERRSVYLPAVSHYGEDNTPFWSGIIAELDQRAHPWKWTIKADVAEALARLGLRPAKGKRA